MAGNSFIKRRKLMTMFDSIIAEADERFNLNGKAGTMLSALLALMTNDTSGGFTGFLERFNAAGLNDAVSSWVNSGENTEISNKQLESALGKDSLSDISNRDGIDYDTSASATAFMIPRVIDALTPGGEMPQEEDLLSRIGGFSKGVDITVGRTDAEETFDRIGTAAVPVLDADKKAADDTNTLGGGASNPVVDRVDAAAASVVDNNQSDKDNSPLGWFLPLLLLGLLLVLGYWFCSRTASPAVGVITDSVNTIRI
jgi:uncharacterized protein YidB (DUF937 family)